MLPRYFEEEFTETLDLNRNIWEIFKRLIPFYQNNDNIDCECVNNTIIFYLFHNFSIGKRKQIQV